MPNGLRPSRVTFEIVFRPQAEADLNALFDYIAEEAGAAVAGNFIGRIEAACLTLETSPQRGAPRDDILPGLRILVFERRTIIVFKVTGSIVDIARIFHGGQDWERWVRDDTGAR